MKLQGLVVDLLHKVCLLEARSMLMSGVGTGLNMPNQPSGPSLFLFFKKKVPPGLPSRKNIVPVLPDIKLIL